MCVWRLVSPFDNGIRVVLGACAEKDLPVFKNKAIKRSFEVLALSGGFVLTAALLEERVDGGTVLECMSRLCC
jgi:hypothetical protein